MPIEFYLGCAVALVTAWVIVVKASRGSNGRGWFHRLRVGHLILACITMAWLVQCAPLDVGLPFGYFGYANRAIDAFRACRNVHSAELSKWNPDFDMEEFWILVEFSGRNGRETKGVFFNQYPTREEIEARVATIGCER